MRRLVLGDAGGGAEERVAGHAVTYFRPVGAARLKHGGLEVCGHSFGLYVVWWVLIWR